MNILKTAPAVFAVGETYQIMVPVNKECLMWVKVGDKCYYDQSNGVLRSLVPVHRVTVPASELEREKKYTLCIRKIIDRKPYFPEIEEVVEMEFNFCPVGNDNIKAYHISDAHGFVDRAVSAAKHFESKYGKIDFLILNVDVIDHSGEIENFDAIYEIAGQITGGNVPVVFSRGNHDLRGTYAESMFEYIPAENGNTYYTFRLGGVWGVILDCGEDKPDTHAEYGGTICCHDFRMSETEYLKKVIESEEYNADGINYRTVISHVPFTSKRQSPFDIEKDIYRDWGTLLRENVKPDVMICGHTHKQRICMPGDEWDEMGHPCPVIECAEVNFEEEYYGGCGFVFSDSGVSVMFNDSEKSTEQRIK